MSDRYVISEKDYGEGNMVYFVTDTLAPNPHGSRRFSNNTKIFYSMHRAEYYKDMMEEYYGQK